MRMPSAPSRMADCTARFMARRKATRRSSCWAMVSATSLASISGLRTSTMLRCTSDVVSLASSPASFSISAPFLPISTPGRAVCTVTRHFLCGRSMTTLEMPAWSLLLEDVLADVHVLVQQPPVLAAAGEPAAVPRAVDAEPKPDRIDLLTHHRRLRLLLRPCAHHDGELRERLLDRGSCGRGRGHGSASSRGSCRHRPRRRPDRRHRGRGCSRHWRSPTMQRTSSRPGDALAREVEIGQRRCRPSCRGSAARRRLSFCGLTRRFFGTALASLSLSARCVAWLAHRL